MNEQRFTKADLRQFAGGTGQWYRHGMIRSILFTDGAKFVADRGGAYWLLDEIAFAQKSQPAVAAEAFQVWTLMVKAYGTATLTCDDGNGTVVWRKGIDLTDFPLDEIQLWFTDNTILLPDEY